MAHPASQRPRYVAGVVVGAVLVVVLTVLLAWAPRPPLVEVVEAPRVTITVSPPPPATPWASPTPLESPPPLPQVEPFDLPDWLPDLLRVLLIAAILGAVAWFLRRLWETRVATDRRGAVAPSGDAVEIAMVDDEQIAEAVEETIASLRRGIAVDGAVIECWRRLERVAADTGVSRRRSQTSEEFTVDVLSRGAIDEGAINDLGDLYRQAMFSTHTLSDADRERAIACLQALSEQLRATP